MAKKNPIKKITDKSKVENSVNKEVNDWLTKISASEEVKKSWREKFRVDLAYEYRDGAQRPSYIPDSEWITINKIYSNLKSELPSLYSNDPYFFIKLATSYSPNPMDIALFEQRAKMRQAMINYLKRELKLKQKVRLCILDAYFQFGVMKIHHSADFIDNPDAEQSMKDENENVIYDENGKEILQPPKLPTNEAYNITRVHPNDFGFDADAGPTEDTWKFVYEIIRMPVEDARKDERYDKSAREKIKPTELDADTANKERERRKKGSKGKSLSSSDIQPSIAVLYEVYDLKKKQMFVVSPGCDEYLIKPDSTPKGIEKHTYAILTIGLARDDSPYPIPPVSQWLDPQRENNELRSKILSHRKRFNRKYIMHDTAFDNPDDAASKLELGADGTILRTNGSFPGEPVLPIRDAPLDQTHTQELLMFRNDFEELSTGANQQGAGAGVDSATEAGIIEKRVVIREGDNMGLVMDFVTDIGRKLDQIVQANITKDQAVKVIGPEGESWEMIRTMDYEQIQGEFEYSVNVGSTIPQLPEIERAQWMQFLSLIAQAPQLALSKTLLKRMATMHRIEDDSMIDEIYQISKAMMGGGLQQPQQMGSLPNVTDPRSKTMGAMGAGAGISNIRGGQQ